MNSEIKLTPEIYNKSFSYGDLKAPPFFVNVFGIFPKKHIYCSDSKFCLIKIDINKLLKDFKGTLITYQSYYDKSTTSCVEDEDEDERVNETVTDYITFITTNKEYVVIDSDSITLYYIDTDPEAFINLILKYIPEEESIFEAANVKLVCRNDSDYYTITSKIEPANINLNENYNDDFIPIYEDLVKFIDERTSGIAILRGKIGSGKTSALRNLITTHPASYIIVTNALAEHLASPEFISFMLSNRNSIFILEDCEQILIDRTDGNFSGAIANILNMADGLMSDIFNIKFICTFNADINKIDGALLRKGRCFVNYEFKELSVDKTKSLLNKQGIELSEYKPMTLAEIYNYEDTDCSQKQIKIGF